MSFCYVFFLFGLFFFDFHCVHRTGYYQSHADFLARLIELVNCLQWIAIEDMNSTMIVGKKCIHGKHLFHFSLLFVSSNIWSIFCTLFFSDTFLIVWRINISRMILIVNGRCQRCQSLIDLVDSTTYKKIIAQIISIHQNNRKLKISHLNDCATGEWTPFKIHIYPNWKCLGSPAWDTQEIETIHVLWKK